MGRCRLTLEGCGLFLELVSSPNSLSKEQTQEWWVFLFMSKLIGNHSLFGVDTRGSVQGQPGLRKTLPVLNKNSIQVIG